MAATYRLSRWRRLLNALVRTFLRVGLGPRHTYERNNPMPRIHARMSLLTALAAMLLAGTSATAQDVKINIGLGLVLLFWYARE